MTPFDYTVGFNLTSKAPRTVRFGVVRVIQDMIKKIYQQSRLLFLLLVELFFRFRLDGLVNCRISLDQKFRYIRRSYPKGSKFSNLELVACGNYFS